MSCRAWPGDHGAIAGGRCSVGSAQRQRTFYCAFASRGFSIEKAALVGGGLDAAPAVDWLKLVLDLIVAFVALIEFLGRR